MEKIPEWDYRTKHQLNYYHELPLLYNACRINFNATHLQMGEAVNQRVFDVLHEEDFCLPTIDPALKNFSMSGRAGNVLKEHTYRHRIERLIGYIKKRFR